MADALKEAVKKVGEGVEKLGVSEPPKSPKQSKKSEPQADKPAVPGAKKDGKKDKKVKFGGSGTADELSPPPAFIQERIDLFDKIKAEYDANVAKNPRVNINILLDNDRIEIGKSWETTPADVAKSISKSLFERVVVAEVDGEVWDLEGLWRRVAGFGYLTLNIQKVERSSGTVQHISWENVPRRDGAAVFA